MELILFGLAAIVAISVSSVKSRMPKQIRRDQLVRIEPGEILMSLPKPSGYRYEVALGPVPDGSIRDPDALGGISTDAKRVAAVLYAASTDSIPWQRHLFATALGMSIDRYGEALVELQRHEMAERALPERLSWIDRFAIWFLSLGTSAQLVQAVKMRVLGECQASAPAVHIGQNAAFFELVRSTTDILAHAKDKIQQPAPPNPSRAKLPGPTGVVPPVAGYRSVPILPNGAFDRSGHE